MPTGGLLVLIGGIGPSRLFDLATRVGAALNIPVMIGAISIVHWGRWNFLPSETHPIGGIEFQVVLLLLMLYLLITGNRDFAASSASRRPTAANLTPLSAVGDLQSSTGTLRFATASS